MARIQFTRHLKRFFPDLDVEAGEVVEGDTVALVVAGLDARFPGLAAYLVDDAGRLRRHVNIFRNGSMLADPHGLTDALQPDDELYIVQSLSGG